MLLGMMKVRTHFKVGAAVEENFAELKNGDPLEAVESIQRDVEYLQRLTNRICQIKCFRSTMMMQRLK